MGLEAGHLADLHEWGKLDIAYLTSPHMHEDPENRARREVLQLGGSRLGYVESSRAEFDKASERTSTPTEDTFKMIREAGVRAV